MRLLNRKPKDKVYNDWVTAIKHARSGRMAMEQCWRRWYNITDDYLWGNRRGNKTYEPIQVNMMQSLLQSIIPNVTFQGGKVELRAFAMEDMIGAAIWEKAAKYLVLKQNLADEFEMVVFNALVLGDGLMKVGHHTLPLLSEPQWNAGLASERGAQPFSVYGAEWPLFEFLPDYSVDRWKRQRFFIHELDKHIDEVHDNPAYNKKQVDKVKPTRRTEEIFYLSHPDKVDKKKDYVAIQEVHDLINAKVMVIAEGAGPDSYLYNEPEPFNMIPMERLSFFPRPMNVFGKGITQSIEKHLLSISKMHTYMEKVARNEALINVLVDVAKIPKEMIKELEKSKDSFIAVTGDPAGSYDIMQFGAASKNFVFDQILGLKKQEIREQAGAGRQQQGMHEPGIRTATESMLLEGNADVINKWRARKFSEFASRVLEKMLFIVSVTYTPERIAKMVGYPVQAIAPFLEPYDPSKYILKYGETAVTDRAERMQKFQAFVGLFGQVLNPAMMIQVAADVFDLEYSDEMLIPGQMMGGGAGQQTGGGQPATAGFRPEESQSQQQAIPGAV